MGKLNKLKIKQLIQDEINTQHMRLMEKNKLINEYKDELEIALRYGTKDCYYAEIIQMNIDKSELEKELIQINYQKLIQRKGAIK